MHVAYGHTGTSQDLRVTQELSEQLILQESNLKVLRRLLPAVSLVPACAQSQSPGNPKGHSPFTTSCRTERPVLQHQTDRIRPLTTSNGAPCSQALMQRLFALARSNDAAIRRGALCCLGKAVGYIINHLPLSDQPSNANAVQLFLELVSEAVRPWQPWQVRAAAARALQQSGQHSFVRRWPSCTSQRHPLLNSTAAEDLLGSVVDHAGIHQTWC